MEANQILQSDILDIIFEGKNKTYGAYDLRKTYNGRISLALLIVFSLIGLTIAGLSFTKKSLTDKVLIPVITRDTELTNVPKDPLPPVPPPPVKTTLVEKVSTVHYANVKISPNEEVLVPPPSMDEIETSRISQENMKGSVDLGIIFPPEPVEGSGVFTHPVEKKDAADVVVFDVQLQASFPGGLHKWSQYIQTAILNELDEFNENDYGTCIVKFVVDKTGRVSNVEATTMKGTKLAQIAVNAIRKGPDWIPAENNGRKVNAYRLQPVTLKNPDR